MGTKTIRFERQKFIRAGLGKTDDDAGSRVWASLQADRLDPLKSKSSSILDQAYAS